MAKKWTRAELQQFIKENNITDMASIEDAFATQFKQLVQMVLEEEMNAKLGYEKYDVKNKESESSRNGHTKKTVKSRYGQFNIEIPRDTEGEFEPVAVKKHERSLSPRLENMIISMYSKGMSTRDIDAHVKDIYGLDVSAEMVSGITDKVLPVAREWQNRPLEPLYPVLYLDGMVFNVTQDAQVVKKTVYVVFAINVEGKKEVLGIWIGEAESAKFWMKVLVDLKNRGVKDILIASVDGLKGFSEAIGAVFPKTEVQKCIVHQVRTSTRFVNYKDLKQFCADMKEIYTAPNEKAGLAALDRFSAKWGKKYFYAVKSWRDNWPVIMPFYRYPEEIRRIIYTTNPIEGFNRRIRKVTKTKGSFPSDESLMKLIYLIVMDASRKWTVPARNWGSIIGQLRIYFGERIDPYLQG